MRTEPGSPPAQVVAGVEQIHRVGSLTYHELAGSLSVCLVAGGSLASRRAGLSRDLPCDPGGTVDLSLAADWSDPLGFDWDNPSATDARQTPGSGSRPASIMTTELHGGTSGENMGQLVIKFRVANASDKPPPQSDLPQRPRTTSAPGARIEGSSAWPVGVTAISYGPTVTMNSRSSTT
jgi:hypothetical protein